MTLLNLTVAWKRNKLLYYIQNHFMQLFSVRLYPKGLNAKLDAYGNKDRSYIENRVAYYNKLGDRQPLGPEGVPLHALKSVKGPRSYFFDLFEFSRYFDQDFKANVLFMDVIHTSKVF